MSSIEISPQLAFAMLIAFMGCIFGFGRILLSQFEKRMNDRFKAIDKVHAAEVKSMQEQLQTESVQLAGLREEVKSLGRILPLEYVRREDWIRFSSAIDHKLDRLAELVMNIAGDKRARN